LKYTYSPSQLDTAGTSGGYKVAIHATRRFFKDMPYNFVVLKIKFSICVRRDSMFAAIADSERKAKKYSKISSNYYFFHLQLEISVPGAELVVTSFLSSLGHRLTLVSDDPRKSSFLFQRLSIYIERFNAHFSVTYSGTCRHNVWINRDAPSFVFNNFL